MTTLTDEAIRRQVEQAIGFEPRASVSDMRVHVLNGVVRLEGIVDQLEAKHAAGSAAKSVPGARRVENTLTVEDPQARNDHAMEAGVAEALSEDPQVDASRVGATVEDGTAHLVGHADSAADEDAAVHAASRAEGIKEIVSEIEIAPGRKMGWVDIKNEVTDALDAAEGLLPYPIDVVVGTEGRVWLQGEVNDEQTRERAETITRRVDGVKAVINDLSVRG